MNKVYRAPYGIVGSSRPRGVAWDALDDDLDDFGSGSSEVLDFTGKSVEVLRERERILIAALKHYANREAWRSCKSSISLKHYRGFSDNGWELAEDALKEVGH